MNRQDRQHQRLEELRTQWQDLSDRIAANVQQLGVTIDAEQKLVLNKRREELEAERDRLDPEIQQIEELLKAKPSPLFDDVSFTANEWETATTRISRRCTCSRGPYGHRIGHSLSLWNPGDYLILFYWIFFNPHQLFEHVDRLGVSNGQNVQGPNAERLPLDQIHWRNLLIQSLVGSEVIFCFIGVAGIALGRVADWHLIPLGMAWIAILALIIHLIGMYLDSRMSPDKIVSYYLFIGVPTGIFSGIIILTGISSGFDALRAALGFALLIGVLSFQFYLRDASDPRYCDSVTQRVKEGLIGGATLGLVVGLFVPELCQLVVPLFSLRIVDFLAISILIALQTGAQPSETSESKVSLFFGDTAIWIPLPGLLSLLTKYPGDSPKASRDRLLLADELVSCTAQFLTVTKWMRDFLPTIPPRDLLNCIDELLRSRNAMTYLTLGDIFVVEDDIKEDRVKALEQDEKVVVFSKKEVVASSSPGTAGGDVSQDLDVYVIMVGRYDIEWLRVQSYADAARAGFLALAKGRPDVAIRCFERIRALPSGEQVYQTTVLLSRFQRLVETLSVPELSLQAKAAELVEVLLRLDSLPAPSIRQGTVQTLQQLRTIAQRVDKGMGSDSSGRYVTLDLVSDEAAALNRSLDIDCPWPEREVIHPVVETWQNALARG